MDAESITDRIVFRCPIPEDGMDVHRLIRQCKPLDENSVYCNLLQCSHFAETSVIAALNSQIIGLTTGYLIPGNNVTLFIWQIAVAESARGQNLAKRLLQSLLQRPICKDVSFLEASVLPGNRASRTVFYNLAKDLNTHCLETVMFEKEQHFEGQHETEVLLRIGPFLSPQRKELGE